MFGQSSILTDVPHLQIGLEHRQLPQTPNATQQRCVLARPINAGSVAGLGLERLGYSEFAEFRIMPTYALRLNEKTALGTRIEWLRWQASDHASVQTLVAGVFAQFKTSPKTTVFAAIFNPNRSPVGKIYPLRTQSWGQLSAQYQPASEVTLGIQYHWQADSERLHLGSLFQLGPDFECGLGWMSQPGRWTSGVSWKVGPWKWNASMLLGLDVPGSLALSLMYGAR